MIWFRQFFKYFNYFPKDFNTLNGHIRVKHKFFNYFLTVVMKIKQTLILTTDIIW